ncbi:MAG TPA: VOC family protein [Propionibacteriaceae bacterium]|nr:VOC family protein [Propionibacteriaceae bacterium]
MATRTAWIGAITIDCSDAEVLRRFYSEALEGGVVPAHPQALRVGELMLVFRELEGWVPPIWPGGNMQMHFEVLVPVGELERQAERLVSLGAQKSSHQDPNDPGLIVFLDPAGHPFCLFEDPEGAGS